MKNVTVGTRVLASAALLVVLVSAAQAAASTRPPKNLKKVGDHWTPWDPPAPGPDSYIIQRGDTLWDLAGKWLGDPYLWPQVWDENRYILDSHWIYPGDPLTIPGRPTVVPTDGPLPEGDAEPVPVVAQDLGQVEPVVTLVPMGDTTDLHCSPYIAAEHVPSQLSIAAHEPDRNGLGEGDVVFLSQGAEQGIRAGDEYAIIRPGRAVEHPETDDHFGTVVHRLGKARVMLAHERSATAVIVMSCTAIMDGDELVPWADIPSPMLSSLPAFERYDPTPSGGATGWLLAIRDDVRLSGTGSIVCTDLGTDAGAAPGSVLTLYRERGGDLPRKNIGQAVVLTARPESSTAKIVLAVEETYVSDRVELVP